MCPNDNQSYSPPPPYYRVDCVFDSEEGSDVTFLVGAEPETWRFPGHRAVLSKANPVFKAMLAHPQHTIAVSDVNGRAFDLLLRHLYKEEVELQSVSTALSTLYAAVKYLCPGLVALCTAYLHDHMTVSNVLEVYQHAKLYSSQGVGRDPWAASAPPYDQVCLDEEPRLEPMLCACSALRRACLLYVDSHADSVFVDESVEDLTPESLRELAARDSLGVSSESVVYHALERWCNRECKRRQLELCHENRRYIVGEDLLFSVRYLLMSQKEFYTGPMQGDLLTKEETTVLIGHILGMPVASSLLSDGVLLSISRQRKCQPASAVPFSPRANKRCFGDKTEGRPESSKGETKKQKKGKKKSKDGSPKRKCTGACIADCVLRALSCLFD